MPELPDVEGYRRAPDAAVAGRRVTRVSVDDAGVLRNVSPASLRRRLTGRTFGHPRRVGKWLMLPTDGPTLRWRTGGVRSNRR